MSATMLDVQYRSSIPIHAPPHHHFTRVRTYIPVCNHRIFAKSIFATRAHFLYTYARTATSYTCTVTPATSSHFLHRCMNLCWRYSLNKTAILEKKKSSVRWYYYSICICRSGPAGRACGTACLDHVFIFSFSTALSCITDGSSITRRRPSDPLHHLLWIRERYTDCWRIDLMSMSVGKKRIISYQLQPIA